MAHDDAGTSRDGKGRRSSFPGSDRDGAAPRVTRASAGATRRSVAVPAALAGGIVAAVFGTLLHAQLLYLGGVALPIGALAALVLAGSLFLLCGLWTRNIFMTAVAGAVAYGLVALLSTSSKTLILTGASDTAPGTALAGNLWLFGVLVTTLVAVMVGSILMRPRARG